MNQNEVAIISKATNSFDSLQKNLKENGLDICTVSSLENILEKYMTFPYVLAIVDANSYGDDTLKLVSHLHGAKPAPILVLMTGLYPGIHLKLLRMGATVCMNMETTPEEQAAQAEALIQIYSARDDNLHRETLAFGTTLVINPIYRLVILNGEKLSLPRREFDLLYFMAKHEMQVFTPEQLYRQLWSDEDNTQIGDRSNLLLRFCERNWSLLAMSSFRMNGEPAIGLLETQKTSNFLFHFVEFHRNPPLFCPYSAPVLTLFSCMLSLSTPTRKCHFSPE